MPPARHRLHLRVRYGETDQMGTFYNARVLDWFECARTELLRSLGASYAAMERQGLFLPVVQAHVDYLGRAQYDDRLALAISAAPAGKVRLRFDVHIAHADGGPDVARGYTVHAVTDAAGRPQRIPAWLLELLDGEAAGRPDGQAAHPNPPETRACP
jgi:acyl-CoA thioester hydrolase